MARDSGLMVLLLILGFGLIWFTIVNQGKAKGGNGATSNGGEGAAGSQASPSLNNLMKDLVQDMGEAMKGFSELVIQGVNGQQVQTSVGATYVPYTGPTSPYDVNLADIFWPQLGITPTSQQIASIPEGKAYGPYLGLWYPSTVKETVETTGKVPQGPI